MYETKEPNSLTSACASYHLPHLQKELCAAKAWKSWVPAYLLPSFPASIFPGYSAPITYSPLLQSMCTAQSLPTVHVAGMHFVYSSPLSQQWNDNSHLGSAHFFREAFPGHSTKPSHLLLAQDPTPDFQVSLRIPSEGLPGPSLTACTICSNSPRQRQFLFSL